MAADGDGPVNFTSVFSDETREMLYAIGVEEEGLDYLQQNADEYLAKFGDDTLAAMRTAHTRYNQWPGVLQSTHIFVCAASQCGAAVEDVEKRKQHTEALARMAGGGTFILTGIALRNPSVLLMGVSQGMDGFYRLFF